MPYIKAEDRPKFKKVIEALREAVPTTPGELNYLFSMIYAMYLKKKGKRYQFMNDIAGASILSLIEIYRRVIGPYEDSAIKKNGDLP